MHCWWECRLVPPLWKTVWNFLGKLKMELPFHPAIPLLGLYPKSPETTIHKNLCPPMLIAAQFTIAKCWKQPKCPSTKEKGKQNITRDIEIKNNLTIARGEERGDSGEKGF